MKTKYIQEIDDLLEMCEMTPGWWKVYWLIRIFLKAPFLFFRDSTEQLVERK